jgi:hypothetical protein
MSVQSVFIFSLLVVYASAASIKWTGIQGNNQWTTAENWYPAQVPSTGDDVTIDSGTVLCTVPTGVNSLVIGTMVTVSGNLTLFQDFYIGSGGMTVEANGNLIINSGSALVSGTVIIAGTLTFGAGTLSGTWTLSNRGSASLIGAGQKTFSGCQFQASGPVSFGGLIALNQSSVITISSTATASGDFAIQAQDTTPVLFDASAGTLTYSGGGDFSIQAPVKLGTFNYQGGNLTIFDSVSFANALVMPSGSYVAVLGAAIVKLTAGLQGAGVFSSQGTTVTFGAISVTGAVNFMAGTNNINAASTIAVTTIGGATVVLSGGITTPQLNLLTGTVQGSSSISATNVYFNSQGFNLNAAISVTGTMTTSGTSLFSFGASAQITFHSASQVNTGGSLQFTGPPGSLGVTNNGVFNANNAVAFQNVNLGGSGSFNVAATLSVTSITFTQSSVALSTNGVFKGTNTDITSVASITGTPSVTAVIGKYTMKCGKQCDDISTKGTPAENFNFSA